MAKFMYLYKGPATPPEQMSEEQGKQTMEKWNVWMGKVGSKVTDMGAPMNPKGAAVVDDGSSGSAESLNGYTIVEASDMDEAKALTEDHPFLSDKTGEFSVEIYELMPLPEFDAPK